MDQRAAQTLAVALCGRRLRRRRLAKAAGVSTVAAASILLLLVVILPLAADIRSALLAALVSAAAAGLALTAQGSRFPRFADAYRDLGLDPLEPHEISQVDELARAHPQLFPELAVRTAYGAPLRRCDLIELRRMVSPLSRRQTTPRS